jgi:hypothetical protein
MIPTHITEAPPEVTNLLEEIRADASLNQNQRNELMRLLERGDVEGASVLLDAWRITR